MKPICNPKNLMFIIAGCLALMICVHVQAQNVDSLEQVLKTQKLTTDERVRIYDDLSWGYLNRHFAKSSAYAMKGIQLAGKDMNMLGRLYRNLGVAYYMNGGYDTARIHLDKALEYAVKRGDENLEASIYGAIGNLHQVKNQSEKALEYYQKSLVLSEKLNNKVRIGTLLGNMGALYKHIDNYAQAEKYYTKAEKLYEENNDLYGLASVKSGLADTYLEKGDYDKALECAQYAADAMHSLGDIAEESTALQMVAFVYKDGFNDYERALEYAGKSLELAEKTGFTRHIVSSLSVLATTQFKMGQYAACEKNALKGLALDSTHIVKKTLLRSALKSAIMLGKKEEALGYELQLNELTFRLSNDEFKQKLFDLELQHETEKKELKISALEEEKRLYVWLGIAGGAVLLLALAFFVVRQRMVQQKVARLEQEQQLISTQAVLDGETAERTRLARDLHDGLGGMLSVVKLNLNDVKKGVSIEGEDVARFDRVIGLLDESIGELRRVAHNMMPDSLTRYGLKVSLTDFCNSIPGAVFNHYGTDGRIDPKLEVMVYRTAHELVNNALKHAAATEIIVQLMQEPNRVSLTVQDDGRGFDTTAPTSGTGLNNIRNRVGSYNGRMDVYSEPGKGTEVSVEFKL